MSDDFLDRISTMSPKRLALLAVQLQEQLEAAGERAREPIAVIGMGCRFPGGVRDPESYWQLLASGRDAIREVPPDRWDIDAYYDPDPDAPARMSTRSGGFLDAIDGFDPAFFGITPREAQTMDPQQRLLLEVAWEALEHAGVSPAALAGSATGVFVGICNNDHFQRVLGRGVGEIDAYLASGNASSVAAGRISYFLGLQGTALAIDTACSSSLVALHVACRSLRTGESRLALAAGVNVMCSPETTIALTKGHMLAPDGRCKTFDAAADGFARGEGCGVLVLKRLSDATADGDRVLALVRGTASNQDGRSGGLTVPNGPAQEAVIRAALSDAGVRPNEIGYVEAHGTGTSLGDPIEVRALHGALGAERPGDDPLLIGSVKTNIGHLESAAGIAGVIKVIVSLLHERIPKHLHFTRPSPHIAWSDCAVAVTSEARDWRRGERRRLAGVSSFGFSGTNAHVIIEEAPLPGDPIAPDARPLHCLPLSARTDEALVQLASECESALSAQAVLADVAHTAGVGRSHFTERAAIVATDAAQARAALTALRNGDTHPALHRGTAVAGRTPEVVFLYTGQGAQYPGMGQSLYDTAPVYREVIDRCDAILGPDAAGRTLRSVLAPGPTDGAPIHETAWTQPALFATEYALTQLWRSWGVEPAAVIGHSVGEYVAACVAGVFTLEEGLRLIAERGRLMQALPAGGMMAAIFAPKDDVAAAVASSGGRLSVAAVNAPDSVVVSGETDAVEALLAAFATRNVQGHRLFVGLAGHSPLVDPALDAMEACARTVTMHAPTIPVAWNVTGGEPLPDAAPDAVYWRRHLREPVRFADGIASLHAAGYRTFLEVGPHPVLMALAQRSLPGRDEGTTFHTSLRRGKDDWSELLATLAELYVQGAPVSWAGFDRPYARRRVSWPTYPFQRRRFWITPGKPDVRRVRAAVGAPLLGERMPTAAAVFQATISPETARYLAEHRVGGAVLVAGPVFLELAQAAAREVQGAVRRSVEGFVVREALVLPEEGRTVETHLTPAPDGSTAFAIHSRAVDGTGEWLLHATGTLGTGRPASADVTPTAAIERELGPEESSAGYYERLESLGIRLGASFRSLREVRRGNGESLARVALPPETVNDDVAWVHPALLDGAFQAVGLAVPESSDTGDVYLLSEVESIDLETPLPQSFLCHARLRPATETRPAEWRADVTLRSDAGVSIGVIRGVSLRRASRQSLARIAGSAETDGLFYGIDWEPAPLAPAAAPSLDDPARFVSRIRGRFESLALTHDLPVYDRLLPALDRLAIDHVANALRTLGFDDTPGRCFTAAEEAANLGVASRHTRLFARLLDMLEEEGVLRRRGDAFEILSALPPRESARRIEELRDEFAGTPGELSTLGRCGPALARVLRGAQDPLQLLFPGGSFAEARQLYVESPFARTYNSALGEALQAAIATVPIGARLRVLEIGAGTGGTTTYALPRLPADRTEYTFTDLSPLFLERAAEQFAEYPFVKRAVLDIERDPSTQGFEAGAYDVVIAANVLHATADLRQALTHARRLLAPGGLLLLLEGVAPERWVDLTFGLTEGWWRFTDAELRESYPLIPRDAWIDLLSSLGFTSSVAIPGSAGAARGTSQQALMLSRAPMAARSWTLVGSGDGVGEALAQRLRARGDSVTTVAADAPESDLDPEAALVYLGALDTAPDVDSSGSLSCATPIEWLARATRGDGGDGSGRVWLVTRGTQAVRGDAAPNAHWQAPLWGIGRVFALEHPTRWGGIVDLPAESHTEALADTLLAAIANGGDAEDQTAWRGGERLAPRLVPAHAPPAKATTFRADATYLVTGGYGGLGLLVARWMAGRGARHIALLGRRPDPNAEGVREIEALGARVLHLAADVADESALGAALATLGTSGAPPLRGVMHAAADLSVAPIGELTATQVSRMLRPKLTGTVLLDRLTSELDFFVLFSSTTALLGASGFAHYAAANAFLDAFAHDATRRGKHVLAVNWGTWEAMRLATEDSQRSYRAGGLLPIPVAAALDALGRVLARDEPQAVVASVDWSLLKPLLESRRARPFLARVGGARPGVAGRAATSTDARTLEARLAGAPADTRHDVVVQFVRDEVAGVLGIESAEAVPMETGLFELGMDSLMSVELKKRLEHGAGRPLPSTLTFNYPNVGALAGFLESELSSAADRVLESVPDESEPALVAANGDLDALSDDELEARLLARLEQLR